MLVSWRLAPLFSLCVLTIVRSVAGQVISQYTDLNAREAQSSIGVAGLVHVPVESASGFTNSNPSYRECQSWDAKGKYNFEKQQGLTLAWYNQTRNISFIFQMCFGMTEIHGVDITQTDNNTLATYESTVNGYYHQMLVVRDRSAPDYDQESPSSWGAPLYMAHVLDHGSQGPPCNQPYDRVSDRTVPFPIGDRSPMAAGHNAYVVQYCSSCEPTATDCTPCPGNTACLANTTYRTTAPFTGATLDATEFSEYACVCHSEQLNACVEVAYIATFCPEEEDTYNMSARFLIAAVPFAMIGLGLLLSYLKFLLKGNTEAVQALAGCVKLYGYCRKQCGYATVANRVDATEFGDDPALLRRRLEDLGNALGFKPAPTLENTQKAVNLRELSRVMMQRSMSKYCEEDVFFAEAVGAKGRSRKKWLQTEWDEHCQQNPLLLKTDD